MKIVQYAKSEKFVGHSFLGNEIIDRFGNKLYINGPLKLISEDGEGRAFVDEFGKVTPPTSEPDLDLTWIK